MSRGQVQVELDAWRREIKIPVAGKTHLSIYINEYSDDSVNSNPRRVELKYKGRDSYLRKQFIALFQQPCTFFNVTVDNRSYRKCKITYNFNDLGYIKSYPPNEISTLTQINQEDGAMRLYYGDSEACHLSKKPPEGLRPMPIQRIYCHFSRPKNPWIGEEIELMIRVEGSADVPTQIGSKNHLAQLKLQVAEVIGIHPWNFSLVHRGKPLNFYQSLDIQGCRDGSVLEVQPKGTDEDDTVAQNVEEWSMYKWTDDSDYVVENFNIILVYNHRSPDAKIPKLPHFFEEELYIPASWVNKSRDNNNYDKHDHQKKRKKKKNETEDSQTDPYQSFSARKMDEDSVNRILRKPQKSSQLDQVLDTETEPQDMEGMKIGPNDSPLYVLRPGAHGISAGYDDLSSSSDPDRAGYQMNPYNMSGSHPHPSVSMAFLEMKDSQAGATVDLTLIQVSGSPSRALDKKKAKRDDLSSGSDLYSSGSDANHRGGPVNMAALFEKSGASFASSNEEADPQPGGQSKSSMDDDLTGSSDSDMSAKGKKPLGGPLNESTANVHSPRPPPGDPFKSSLDDDLTGSSSTDMAERQMNPPGSPEGPGGSDRNMAPIEMSGAPPGATVFYDESRDVIVIEIPHGSEFLQNYEQLAFGVDDDVGQQGVVDLEKVPREYRQPGMAKQESNSGKAPHPSTNSAKGNQESGKSFGGEGNKTLKSGSKALFNNAFTDTRIDDLSRGFETTKYTSSKDAPGLSKGLFNPDESAQNMEKGQPSSTTRKATKSLGIVFKKSGRKSIKSNTSIKSSKSIKSIKSAKSNNLKNSLTSIMASKSNLSLNSVKPKKSLTSLNSLKSLKSRSTDSDKVSSSASKKAKSQTEENELIPIKIPVPPEGSQKEVEVEGYLDENGMMVVEFHKDENGEKSPDNLTGGKSISMVPASQIHKSSKTDSLETKLASKVSVMKYDSTDTDSEPGKKKDNDGKPGAKASTSLGEMSDANAKISKASKAEKSSVKSLASKAPPPKNYKRKDGKSRGAKESDKDGSGGAKKGRKMSNNKKSKMTNDGGKKGDGAKISKSAGQSNNKAAKGTKKKGHSRRSMTESLKDKNEQSGSLKSDSSDSLPTKQAKQTGASKASGSKDSSGSSGEKTVKASKEQNAKAKKK